jgi:hypothetical protein
MPDEERLDLTLAAAFLAMDLGVVTRRSLAASGVPQVELVRISV